MVGKDYAEWNAIQANRERLLEYKRQLLQINSSLLDIDCREAQLTANLTRKRDEGLHLSKTSNEREDVAHGKSKRPVFVVSSRKKPVLVQPGPHHRSGLRSSHASLCNVGAQSSPVPTGLSSRRARDSETDFLEAAQRKLQSTKFNAYLSDMIDRKVERAVDAKIDALSREQKALLCPPLDACEGRSSIIAQEEPSSGTTLLRRPLVESEDEKETIIVAEDRDVVASAAGVEVSEEVKIQVEDNLAERDVVEPIVVPTEAICSRGKELVNTVDSATQTRYSSFAPSHVKQKQITMTVSKRKTTDQSTSPYTSHDELARMAQRLSSTSLISQNTNRMRVTNGAFMSGANICCCESLEQHARTCPSNTSLPLHTIQRARPVRLHKASPLSLEFKHRTSNPVCPPVSRRPVDQIETMQTGAARNRRRAKQDSSVSLGIKMQSGQAFDNDRKFKSLPGNIKSRTGRGRLRKILFGV